MECSTGIGPKPWFLLNDVSRQLRNRFDRQARALGLTRAQWRVMMFLRRHERTTKRIGGIVGSKEHTLAGISTD